MLNRQTVQLKAHANKNAIDSKNLMLSGKRDVQMIRFCITDQFVNDRFCVESDDQMVNFHSKKTK